MQIPFEAYNIFGGFGNSSLNSDTYKAEIYIGNQLVQSQIITGPDVLIQQEFMNIVNQIISQKQPMKVKFIRHINIYDRFENKTKQLETTLEFWNWKDEE